MARRAGKVNEAVREALSEIIRREVRDPRVGFMSVTDVEVAPDLSSAKVFVSVMGEEEEQKDTLAVLHRARGFLRTELARRIRNMRHVPELLFRLDTSIQTGIRVHELLEQVKRESAAFPSPSDTPSGAVESGAGENAERVDGAPSAPGAAD